MRCPDCGQEMSHICDMACVDICWPCEWTKRPNMAPPRLRPIYEARAIAKAEGGK
jgi:hypothetical protein